MLARLREINDVPIHSVEEECFCNYGRILKGYDFSGWIAYMKEYTQIPVEGSCYVASDPGLEKLEEFSVIQDTVYGGMPVQAGYCNGRNSTYSGFEYHKGSEINIAVTDLMLALGHSYAIRNNAYDVSWAEVFYVPQGCVIEMYQTTLHLSPMRVREEGFMDIVVLPRGTNTPLTKLEKAEQEKCAQEENRLLLQRNKWILAHPDCEHLIQQGAYPGVTGINKELYFVQ